MRLRLLPTLVLVLALTACGGGGGGGGEKSSATAPAGASLVPASTPLFVAATTDESSDQWQKADALLKRFPGRDRLLEYVRKELAQEGISYERDLRPALGPEVDLAVFDFEDADNSAVGMTKPDDPDKLVALLQKSDDPPKVIKKRDDGWVVFSDSQAAVDKLGTDGPKLADSDDFKDALDELPDDALASAWVAGKPARDLLQQQAEDQADSASLTYFRKLEWAAAAVEAREDGAAVEIAAKGLSQTATTYKSALLDKVPSDALLFATTNPPGESVDAGVRALGPQAPFLEGVIGIKIPDLANLLKGELTFYARAGTPIPEAALVFEDDSSRNVATLDKLATKAASSFGGEAPTTTTIDGVQMKELRFGPVGVFYGRVDGRILVTDTRNAIRDLREGAQHSLADDDIFKAAKDAAGMPDENAGFVYANLKDGIPEVEGLANDSIPPDVQANLRPLRTLLAWASVDGDVLKYAIFVEIK